MTIKKMDRSTPAPIRHGVRKLVRPSDTLANNIGLNTRIEPSNAINCLWNVNMDQGSQIIRVPEGSSIKNINLRGGASYQSKWAVLRGAVLKFGPGRQNIPIQIDGHGLIIPPGHTVMDEESFNYIVEKVNQGRTPPYELPKVSASEPLFMVHASYCHPDQLFLPQGVFTDTYLSEKFVPGGRHLQIRNGIVYLKEKDLPAIKGSIDILDQVAITPVAIVIQLFEGGRIILKPQG